MYKTVRAYNILYSESTCDNFLRVLGEWNNILHFISQNVSLIALPIIITN